MSQGWKDSQNAQFGRRRAPPSSNPPPLWQRTLEVVRSSLPSISVPSSPPFPVSLEWDKIAKHPSADPEAGGLHKRRAMNKRVQVANVLAAVKDILSHFPSPSPPHLVEFCASSGYVALPFKVLNPSAHVTILDPKASSINIGFSRIEGLSLPGMQSGVRAVLGTTETFKEVFDIGVALHACGEATDAVLDACIGESINTCQAPMRLLPPPSPPPPPPPQKKGLHLSFVRAVSAESVATP